MKHYISVLLTTVHLECWTPYRIVVGSSTLITVLHTNDESEIGNQHF